MGVSAGLRILILQGHLMTLFLGYTLLALHESTASPIHPSTIFCNSKVHTENRVSPQLRAKLLFLNLKNNQHGKVFLSVVYKAISVEPQIDVEDLNLAEDITQLIRKTLAVCMRSILRPSTHIRWFLLKGLY